MALREGARRLPRLCRNSPITSDVKGLTPDPETVHHVSPDVITLPEDARHRMSQTPKKSFIHS